MIVWKVTEQQADQILTALGQRPYLEVQGLIGVLLRQAQESQMQQMPASESTDNVPVPKNNGALVS